MLAGLVASIPSPSSGDLSLGPVRITAYGLMIAIGVYLALELSRRRAPTRGISTEDLSTIAVWAIPAGIVGARLYHVITDWQRFRGAWEDTVKIWEGGLGIPGGLIAGVGVGMWVAHRRGVALADAADVVAPALPLAQAVGRWGNWWNQELFGRPTDLPWGLEIDAANRPAEHASASTFHPTFLYESLWNLGLVVGLLWLDRRRGSRSTAARRLAPGQLFALYVGGYGLGRLWVEALRIDEASLIGPFRVNIWMSLALIAGGAVAYWLLGRRRRDVPAPSGGELVEDGVAERRPQVDRPSTELEVGEGDARQPDGGVDPEERAASSEVAERPR